MTTYGKALVTEEQFLEKSVLDGRALGVGNIRNSFNYEREKPSKGVSFMFPNELNLFSLIPDGWEQHTWGIAKRDRLVP